MNTKHNRIPPHIREHLAYDPENGKFTWSDPQCSTIKAGTEAGHLKKTDSYQRINFEGVTYIASRVAWFLYYGEDPGELTVDHINRIRTDNRIINLRLATRLEQIHNQDHLGYSYSSRRNLFRISITKRDSTGKAISKTSTTARCPLLARYIYLDANQDVENPNQQFLPQDKTKIVGYPPDKSCHLTQTERALGYYKHHKRLMVSVRIEGKQKLIEIVDCPLLARIKWLSVINDINPLINPPFVPPTNIIPNPHYA